MGVVQCVMGWYSVCCWCRWPLTTTTCAWCRRWRCLNMHWSTHRAMTWPRSCGTRAPGQRWVSFLLLSYQWSFCCFCDVCVCGFYACDSCVFGFCVCGFYFCDVCVCMFYVCGVCVCQFCVCVVFVSVGFVSVWCLSLSVLCLLVFVCVMFMYVMFVCVVFVFVVFVFVWCLCVWCVYLWCHLRVLMHYLCFLCLVLNPLLVVCVTGVVWPPDQLHPLPGRHVHGGLCPGPGGQVSGLHTLTQLGSPVCVCVCVCVCEHVGVSICVFVFVHVCVWEYVFMCEHVCVVLCASINILFHVCSHRGDIRQKQKLTIIIYTNFPTGLWTIDFVCTCVCVRAWYISPDSMLVSAKF